MTTDKKLTVDDLSPDQRKVYDVMFDWSESRWSNLLTWADLPEWERAHFLVSSPSRSRTATSAQSRTAVTPVVLPASWLESSRPHVSRRLRTLREGKALTGRFKNLFYSAFPRSRHAVLRHDPSPSLPARHRRQDRGAERLDQARQARSDVRLIIVDEASMVSDDLLRDLQFHGAPILAVGDHGQLPPVMASGDLMQKPMLRLEKIHRQAEGSPIIRLAHHVREGGGLAAWQAGKSAAKQDAVRFFSKSETDSVLREAYLNSNPLDVVTLCWMNKTRCRLNESVRKALGHDGDDVILDAGEVASASRTSPPSTTACVGWLSATQLPMTKNPGERTWRSTSPRRVCSGRSSRSASHNSVERRLTPRSMIW